jgi:hypothetical protein
MLKKAALIFGIIFILIGLIGFLITLLPNTLPFLAFFSPTLGQSCLQVAVGISSVWCGGRTTYTCRLFFQMIGVVYAILALLGARFLTEDAFGLISHHQATLWFQTAVALTTLSLGFFSEDT